MPEERVEYRIKFERLWGDSWLNDRWPSGIAGWVEKGTAERRRDCLLAASAFYRNVRIESRTVTVGEWKESKG